MAKHLRYRHLLERVAMLLVALLVAIHGVGQQPVQLPKVSQTPVPLDLPKQQDILKAGKQVTGKAQQAGRSTINSATNGIKTIVKKHQPTAFITAPIGRYTIDYLDGRRSGLVMTGQPTTYITGSANLSVQVLGIPLLIRGHYGNDNNPQMQPALRWAVEFDIEQFIMNKRQAIDQDIKALESELNTKFMQKIDSAYQSLQKVKNAAVDSVNRLNKINQSTQQDGIKYFESLKERQKDSLKLAAPDIKAWREKSFVSEPDRWIAHNPEAWTNYQKLKDLKAKREQLDQQLNNPSLILTRSIKVTQFKLGTKLLTLPMNSANGSPIDGIHTGLRVLGGQLLIGGGKLRYNRALTPFPESNAAYFQLKEVKTRIGQFDGYLIGVHDQLNNQRPVINADSIAYFLPKHNYVTGLAYEHKISISSQTDDKNPKNQSALHIKLGTALSHTSLTGPYELTNQDAFGGLGQYYHANTMWQYRLTNVLINGRYISRNFFSTANPYLQAGMSDWGIRLTQQLHKTSHLNLDAQVIQVVNRHTIASVRLLAGRLIQLFKQKYQVSLGLKDQSSMIQLTNLLQDTTNRRQQVSSLDLKAQGQLSNWLSLEVMTALLRLNQANSNNEVQSLQQTYGANINLRPSNFAQFKLGFASDYVTNADLIMGPRVPSGRVFKTLLSGQFTVKRIMCTADGFINQGEQNYQAINAQVKLSYQFSKYFTGHLSYMNQRLSGPFEQYNYFNEQVGIGLTGNL